MTNSNYLQDKNFLRKLDNENLRYYLIKIYLLDAKEHPIEEIGGQIQTGSTINIDGNSSVRRTCNLTFVLNESERGDLTDINNLLSLNKKVKIELGLRNTTDENQQYEIIWFPLGIFVIQQANVTHSTTNCSVNITCKDKMCLLNGECGGNLPASITFDSYDQIIGLLDVKSDPATEEGPVPLNAEKPVNKNDYTIYRWKDGDVYHYKSWSRLGGWVVEAGTTRVGTRESRENLFFDIIQTLVINYGGESIGNVMINDIPLEIKQICRYIGSAPLYYNRETGQYSYSLEDVNTSSADITVFNYNDDIGYMYVPFVCDSSLVSNIGDNICTILDNIKNKLGNFEYFYDVDGVFHFQEIRNYLNNAYDPTDEYRLDTVRNHSWYQYSEIDREQQQIYINSNSAIINDNNFRVNYYAYDDKVYNFNQDNGLVTSYSNTPIYSNIKNDFHIWGKGQEDRVIHYHLVIKKIPELNNQPILSNINENLDKFWYVLFGVDENGNYNGTLRLATEDEKNWVISDDTKKSYFLDIEEKRYELPCWEAPFRDDYIEIVNGNGILARTDAVIRCYLPSDWRALLYLQGLEEQLQGLRPNVYKQELLDLFDGIYDMAGSLDHQITDQIFSPQFKTDMCLSPNNLDYFIDFIHPKDGLFFDFSVDSIGTKIKSYQQDKIRRLYNMDIPDRILILSPKTTDEDVGLDPVTYIELISRCDREGQMFSQITPKIYSTIARNTWGYTCQEVARDLLYQYITYNESISLQTIPIYYLDVNRLISVTDVKSGIYGDYIIKTISLPLDAGATMTITATRANTRI